MDSPHTGASLSHTKMTCTLTLSHWEGRVDTCDFTEGPGGRHAQWDELDA